MKKILSVVGASLVLAASLLVTSCGETEGDEFYATTGIASPSVTVKAYPGVNVLTWKAVKDAASYDVYVAVGENAEVFKKNIAALTSQGAYFFTDTVEEALVAGKSLNYKYRVVANAKSYSAPLTSSEWSGSVSTKATQAANGTKFSALNSADYENEFSSDASVLSASTIKVASLVTNGYATVSFPVKSYASYEIYANYIENVNPDLLATVEGAYYKNNEAATVKIEKLSGGDKTVTIVATPYYEGYAKETFTAADKITVAALNVKTGEGTRDAEAVATSETSAKISWTPAVLADGTTAATTCYAVYRKNADGSVAKVEGEVAADSTGTYYITDTIANSAVSATYIIVLSKDGSYGEPAYVTLSVGSLENISVSNTSVTAEYTAEGKARIYWTAATYIEDGEEIDTKLYKVYRKVSGLDDNTYTLLSATATASELTSVTSGSSASKVGTRLYIDDTIENTKVAYIYKVVISDGTSEASSKYTGYLSAYSASVDSVATPSVVATAYIDGTDHAETSIKITSTKNSSDKNETLKLYYAVLAEDTSSYVIAGSEWEEITLANYDSAAGTYYNYLTEQKPGLYVFKLVASEDGKEDSVAYDTETVKTENVSVTDGRVNLAASKQYKTNTDGTTDSSTVVGYLCTYTDYALSGTDSLSNYTYTLYRSVITTKYSGYSTGYITAVSTEPLKVLATPAYNADTYAYESTYLDTDVQTVGVDENSKTIKYYVVKKSATSESRVASDSITL